MTSEFDATVDKAFDQLRGTPQIDRAAALVSNLADYGLVWVLIALWKCRRSGPARRRAILALGAAGFSSLGLSRVIKSSVDRQRPEEHMEATVRTPTSSSFPSGHTLAAFCTAVVLSESDIETTAFVGFASAVAVSRVHLRAHHPSDVVGGAAIGSLLGVMLRPVVQAITPGKRKAQARRRTEKVVLGMGGQDYLLKRL
jgi:undecaprenyl-diphosphatase